MRDCRGKAIDLKAARNCAVAACDLRNVGSGVFLGDDTHACRVVEKLRDDPEVDATVGMLERAIGLVPRTTRRERRSASRS